MDEMFASSHPSIYPSIHLFVRGHPPGRGRWHAPSSRHRWALLNACGRCSFGGLVVRVCVPVPGVFSLSVCPVCVWPVDCLIYLSVYLSLVHVQWTWSIHPSIDLSVYRSTVESRIGPTRYFGWTPGELIPISKPNPDPKSEKPPARKWFSKPNLWNSLGRFDGVQARWAWIGPTLVMHARPARRREVLTEQRAEVRASGAYHQGRGYEAIFIYLYIYIYLDLYIYAYICI